MTICISNKFPEDAKAAGPVTLSRNALSWGYLSTLTKYKNVLWVLCKAITLHPATLFFPLRKECTHTTHIHHTPHTWRKKFRITKTKVVWNLSFSQTVILQFFQNRTKRRGRRSPLSPGSCSLTGCPVHAALLKPQLCDQLISEM